jgi:ABC-type lipoprotein export system ATPase subunit
MTIDLTKLRKAFGHHEALKDLTVSFPEAGFVLLEGENGSGKTSLLNILGLLDTKYEGNYHLDGKEAKSLSDKQRADIRFRKISYVFQKNNLVSYLSRQENALLIENLKGETEKEEKGKTPLSSLSQGQQEICALERGLKPGKEIYLMDEVTSSLDEYHARSTIAKLKELSKTALVVLISHDREAEQIADQILILENGHLRYLKKAECASFEETDGKEAQT